MTIFGVPKGGHAVRGARALSLDVVSYLLRDEFTTNLAAGSVNGTLAEPGPGTRVVVDTNTKISIASGLLTFATGAAANDGLWLDAVTRGAGKVLAATVTPSNTTGLIAVGWDTNQAGAINDALRLNASGVIEVVPNGGTAIAVGVYTATEYKVRGVQRATGIFWYIKGGAFTDWTFLWATAAGTATVYPGVQAQNTVSVFTADLIHYPQPTWLGIPLLSDAFTRANGALGNTDGAGHAEANGGGGLAWEFVAGIWTIATNKAVGSPVAGSEVLTDGTFTNWTADDLDSWPTQGTEDAGSYITENAGRVNLVSDGDIIGIKQQTLTQHTWYTLSLEVVTATSGNIKISTDTATILPNINLARTWLATFREPDATGAIQILRAAACNYLFDNLSVKPLTLSELFATIDIGQKDVIASVDLAVLKSTWAGLCLNLDSKDTPANFVIATYDGVTAKLEKCVAGVYTTVISAAATYAANATLRVIKDGTSYSLFYNNLAVGTVQTISDAGIVSNTRHGLFNTYAGNTMDNAVIWSRKTGYNKLDKF